MRRYRAWRVRESGDVSTGRGEATLRSGGLDWINLILGAWLIIAPFIGIGALSVAASWSSIISGAVIVIAAAVAVFRPQAWEEWVNALTGVWLIISPFVLGYVFLTAATWNHVIVGVIVAAMAIWALQRVHGVASERMA